MKTLQHRLRNFQAFKKKGVPNIDEAKHNELYEKLTISENELQSKKYTLSILTQELNADKKSRDELIERVIKLGGGDSSIAKLGEVVTQKKEAEMKRDAHRDELDKVLSDKLPFHLMSSDLIFDFKNQLKMERNKRNWDAECNALKPKKDKFVDRFFDDSNGLFSPPLTAAQEQQIESRLNDAWSSLFFPPPDGCASEIIHSYIDGDVYVEVERLLQSKLIGSDDIRELLREINSLEDTIRDLEHKQVRLEGIDQDGTLKQINDELAAAEARVERKSKEVGALEKECNVLESSVNDLRATYMREHERFVQSTPASSQIKKAEKVLDLIQQLIPRLYDLKIKHLEKAMTDVFTKLAHKTNIKRIEISGDGQTRLLSRDGSVLTFDKSAGEDQLFATALLAALARVSGVKAPLVVDTPLGRLDSKHRQNILTFWTSDKNRQVILLSQDEEIGHEYYKAIMPCVSKAYLLEHIEIEGGVGKTTATEGYF